MAVHRLQLKLMLIIKKTMINFLQTILKGSVKKMHDRVPCLNMILLNAYGIYGF